VENKEIIYEEWARKGKAVVELETEVFESLFDEKGELQTVVKDFFDSYVEVCKDKIEKFGRFPTQKEVGEKIKEKRGGKRTPKGFVEDVYNNYPMGKFILKIQVEPGTINLYDQKYEGIYMKKHKRRAGHKLDTRNRYLVPRSEEFKDKGKKYTSLVLDFEKGDVCCPERNHEGWAGTGEPGKKEYPVQGEIKTIKLKSLYVIAAIVILIAAGMLFYISLQPPPKSYSLGFWTGEDEYGSYFVLDVYNKHNSRIDAKLQLYNKSITYAEGKFKSSRKDNEIMLIADRTYENKVYFTPESDEVIFNLSISGTNKGTPIPEGIYCTMKTKIDGVDLISCISDKDKRTITITGKN